MTVIEKKRRKLDDALRDVIAGEKNQGQKKVVKEKLKLALQSDDKGCNTILNAFDAQYRQNVVLETILELFPEMKSNATLSKPFIDLFTAYFATLGVDSAAETYRKIISGAKQCVEVVYSRNVIELLRLFLNSLSLSGSVFKKISEQAKLDFVSLTDEVWASGEKEESLLLIFTVLDAVAAGQQYWDAKKDSDYLRNLLKNKKDTFNSALISLTFSEEIEEWAVKAVSELEPENGRLMQIIIREKMGKLENRLGVSDLTKILCVLEEKDLLDVLRASPKLEITALNVLLPSGSQILKATSQFFSETGYMLDDAVRFITSAFEDVKKKKKIDNENITEKLNILEKLIRKRFFDRQRAAHVLVWLLTVILAVREESLVKKCGDLFDLLIGNMGQKDAKELLKKISESQNDEVARKRFSELVEGTWNASSEFLSFLTVGEWAATHQEDDLEKATDVLIVAEAFFNVNQKSPDMKWLKKFAYPTIKKLVKKGKRLEDVFRILKWINYNDCAEGIDEETKEKAKSLVFETMEMEKPSSKLLLMGVEMIMKTSPVDKKAEIKQSFITPERLLKIGQFAPDAFSLIFKDGEVLFGIFSDPDFLKSPYAKEAIYSALVNIAGLKNEIKNIFKDVVIIVKNLPGQTLRELQILAKIVEIYGGTEYENSIVQLCLATIVANRWAEKEGIQKTEEQEGATWSDVIVTVSATLESLWKNAKKTVGKNCATIYSNQVARLIRNSQNFVRLYEHSQDQKVHCYRVLDATARLVDYMKNSEKQFSQLAASMIADNVYFGSFTMLAMAKIHNFAEKNAPAMLSTNLPPVDRIRYKKILPIIQKSQKRLY